MLIFDHIISRLAGRNIIMLAYREIDEHYLFHFLCFEHIFNNQAKPSRQACLSASERRLLRGGSSKDERSATHQAATLAPQRSSTMRKRSASRVRTQIGTQEKFSPLEPDFKGFSNEKCRELSLLLVDVLPRR